MTAASRTAKSEIRTHFFTAWKDGLANGLPNSTPPLAALVFNDDGGTAYSPEVFWQNVESIENLPKDRHFALFSTSDIRTIRRTVAGAQKSKFTTYGVGLTRLYFSRRTYKTADEDFLCAICQETFLGKRKDSVIFRNVTIQEAKPEEAFFRADVHFEYDYDTHI